MKPLVFVDLDDTLFQSRRKSLGEILEVAAYDRTNNPVSFMTSRQRAFFDWLVRDSELVATTGRNADAYRRVHLRLPGYAICSHGGLILQSDGCPEPRWWSQIAAEAMTCRNLLVDVGEFIRSRISEASVDARVRPVSEQGFDLYISIKHNQEIASELARAATLLAEGLPQGWRLILNGNNLAVLPPYLGKERAVAWFLQEIAEPNSFVLAAGDSLSDLGFMALCDYALLPRNSQLLSCLLTRAL